MVIYDKANVKKQKDILSKLVDIDTEIGSEFEAQKMIFEKMKEYIEENKFDKYSVNIFVNDDTKTKWKQSSKEENEFLKIFYNEVKYASNTYGVTKGELSFFYSLGEYLLWESNLLVDEEGRPLNQKALIKELGLGRTTVRVNIKSLEEKKFLIRIWDGRDVYFMVNPYLMVKGQRLNKGIPKVFELIDYVPMCKNKKKENPK